jgi:hypothetical protein
MLTSLHLQGVCRIYIIKSCTLAVRRANKLTSVRLLTQKQLLENKATVHNCRVTVRPEHRWRLRHHQNLSYASLRHH